MDSTINPLAELKDASQRQRWFKMMDSDVQARAACKAWVESASLTDMFHDAIPEVYQVYMSQLLQGNERQHIKKVRRRGGFSLEVLQPIKVGRGVDDFGRRVFEEYEVGEYTGLDAEEALQIFSKYGPYSKQDFNRDKVREILPSSKKKAKKAS